MEVVEEPQQPRRNIDPQIDASLSLSRDSIDKDKREALTVRALHALLSRVTYSEQIGARCCVQGLFTYKPYHFLGNL